MATTFLTIRNVARLLRVGETTADALARSRGRAGAVQAGIQRRVSRPRLERSAEPTAGPTGHKRRSPSASGRRTVR